MNDKYPSNLIFDFFVDVKKSESDALRRALEEDFSDVGKASPIGQKFFDADEFLFSKIFPDIISLLKNKDFIGEAIEIEGRKLKLEIEGHYSNLEDDRFEQNKEILLIEMKENNLEDLSIETLEMNANSIYYSAILPWLNGKVLPIQNKKIIFMFICLEFFMRIFAENMIGTRNIIKHH